MEKFHYTRRMSFDRAKNLYQLQLAHYEVITSMTRTVGSRRLRHIVALLTVSLGVATICRVAGIS
jgi:hypothetical protein